MDLWLEASCSETEGDERQWIWRTDPPFVCLRGETLLASIKEREAVVFVFAVVVAGVGCVSGRLSSVVVVVIRFGFKAQQSNGLHVCRKAR